MKFVKLAIKVPKDELFAVMSKNDLVNEGSNVDDAHGKPHMTVTRKNDHVKIKCKMMGTSTADNGAIIGTYFKGKLTEKNGITVLKGIIVTSVLYHIVFSALVLFFLYKCISLGAISVLPICLIAVSYFLFRGEYRKQKIIKSYIYRAFRKTHELKFKQYNKTNNDK